MGALVRSMDWAKTPLGDISRWPQSLRTTVSLCLASNFPISLAWGPKHVQIYNDGYWPICGAKHPHSVGQDFSECWASAWPVIGEAFERALAGQTSYLENQRMFLDRNGYLEETFFTFSFSPIQDETGKVGGLFHPVTETTSKMLAERRTRALRDLAARAGKARSLEEAFTLAAQSLSESDLDLPFLLCYAVDDRGREARLVAGNGLAAGTGASPRVVDLAAPQEAPWPLAEVVRSRQPRQIDDLNARLGPLSCAPYPEPPKTAMALPITPPGHERPLGIIVAGVSSRLPLNDAYRAFYDLLAAGVTTAVAIGRAYEDERKRAEALAEIDRAKTAFFSNVSHEFRTPLTLILGPLEDELAEHESPLAPSRRERLDAAHRNALRLLKLVNSLLDFSRIEAGRVQASFEATDLAAYTAELAGVFRSAVDKAGLSLVVDCPAMPEPLYIDREMWEKIVLNLLSNAFKHTFEGSITVRLRWCGDGAELEVADTGVGIPEGERARLFERFHRVKGAKSRSHEGTGIGLALIKELVGLHRGTVRVESREGAGSTFIVAIKNGSAHLPQGQIGMERTLSSSAARAAAYVEEALHWLPDPPSASGAALVPAVAEEPGSTVTTAAAAGGPRSRILLADDNADMRKYVQRLLGDKYAVRAVPDGVAALAAAREEPPDLVLSDVMMPGLDGFGLLQELRKDERTRTVPVILLSARAGEEATVEGLGAGADDYVVKPFSARELLARVRTHLQIAQMRRAWAIELEQANKELEAFSYSVSHDLRAPLRWIDGFSQGLMEECAGTLGAGPQDKLRRIRAGVQHMSALIEGLLKLSRVTRTELTRQRVDLSGMVRELASELRRRDAERTLSLHIQEGLVAQGDPLLLRIVLENLLQNAWKFTRKKTEATIEFNTSRTDEGSVYCLRDNGAGFDMAYVDKLFSPFRRLHAATDFEGTGIGLATVARVIRRHGGRIWAEGKVNQGAAFYFTLGSNN
ncbi:MAG: two-component system sensor histidine kinase/response regulator [Acidobacteria bacterium]|nr:MAG: two-component system sensor histidine kinase/response regulator [Acidobacteriota bacterium]